MTDEIDQLRDELARLKDERELVKRSTIQALGVLNAEAYMANLSNLWAPVAPTRKSDAIVILERLYDRLDGGTP